MDRVKVVVVCFSMLEIDLDTGRQMAYHTLVDDVVMSTCCDKHYNLMGNGVGLLMARMEKDDRIHDVLGSCSDLHLVHMSHHGCVVGRMSAFGSSEIVHRPEERNMDDDDHCLALHHHVDDGQVGRVGFEVRPDLAHGHPSTF